MKVGKVAEIAFRGGAENAVTKKREPMVRVRVSIEKRYLSSIRENALVYVTNQSVLGEPFLAIEPGSVDRPVLAEGATLRGLDPPRFDMILAEMYDVLHGVALGIRDNKAEIREAFDGLRHTLKGTGDFFEKNGPRLERIADNAERLSSEANEFLEAARGKFVDNPKVDRILENIDHISGDLARDVPPLLSDAKDTMGNGKRISEALSDPKELAKIRQTLSDVSEIASHGKSAAATADDILNHVKRGRGSVGAMLMDDQLFDDLEEMIRDLKRHPWKFIWRD